MKRFRPPSFRRTLAVTPYHHHHLLLHHRPLSTSSHRPQAYLPHPQGTPDELTFSSHEMLQTIKAMQGQEDDKGSRRLDFISYSKSNPTSTSTTTTSTTPSPTIKIHPSNLSKAELCAKYSIHPRNLGIIDPSQSLSIGQYQYPTKTSSSEAVIVPLKEVILVNLLYVKALITCSHVLLFSPVDVPLLPGNTAGITGVGTNTLTVDTADDQPHTDLGKIGGHPIVQRGSGVDLIGSVNSTNDGNNEEVLFNMFGRYLEQRLSRNSGDPFEHRALESLLTTLTSIFEAELALLVSRTDALVHDLAEDITREELNRLLGLRGAVGECLGRTLGIRRAVDRLLSEDADLAAAYLTAKATNTPRTTADHEELELLLENYSQRFEGIITGVNGALARIKSNQDVVELSLASTRNKLLLLDLKLSLCTVGLTLGAFGAGLLGMNLTNHFEDDPTAFYEVSAGLILLTSVVGGLGIRALRRISRAGLGSLARIATRR